MNPNPEFDQESNKFMIYDENHELCHEYYTESSLYSPKWHQEYMQCANNMFYYSS